MLLGIDIGGMTIKVGLCTSGGKILSRFVVDTPSEISCEATEKLARAIAHFASESIPEFTTDNFSAAALENPNDNIEAIGIAVPGIVDANNEVRMTPNIKIDLPDFVRALEEAFPKAYVIALNDANAAALGEQKYGAGEHSENMVFITLGTGVGGGIIVNNQLVPGRRGGAGEMGHVTVDDEGELCGCGRRGCLALYCSSRGVVKLYKEKFQEALAKQDETGAAAPLKEVSFDHAAHAKPVFDAAREGDEIAQAAISTMTGYLASALVTIACILDPQSFILGGGLSASFDLFGKDLIANFQETALPAQRNIVIKKAKLENDAGMLGAAFYALQSMPFVA